IDRIVSTVGRRVDESSPMCDARLRDGSRVNVIIPPLALDGPCMTIRKFAREKLRAEDLVGRGSGSPEMLAYLGSGVRSRLDMLQAMSTGHEGSMSTVHANSPRDALARLETMVLMAGTDLPARAILKQIASAVDLIVQTQRLRGGARKIVSIAEITGIEDGDLPFQELFHYRQVGIDDSGDAVGYHTATGMTSTRLERFRSA